MRYRPPNAALSSLVEDFADLRADYAAAKPSRFKRQRRGLLPYGSSSDYSLRVPTDYYSIIEQSRDMDRNDVLIGQMVTRACDNILQDGLRPDPQTGDKPLDAEFRERWREWSTNPDECDAAGVSDFDGLTFLALRQFLVDGDVFPFLLRDGQVQMVEGHLCRSILPPEKNVVLGVELDRRRRAVAYHFDDDSINPMQQTLQMGEARRFRVRDAEGERVVCQVMDRRRSSQTRGMGALTPVVDTAGMTDDTLFAALVKQQVSACFAIFREWELGSEPPSALGATGATSTSPNADGTTQTLQGIGPGMEITGKPGEKLSGFSPAVPGDGFFPHTRLLISLISINLGMPLILSLLDASETNFSSWRGVIDQARIGFRRLQTVLRTTFLVPAYRWKIRQWLAEDGVARALAEAGKLFPLRHRWNRPAWPYIDPLKDSQADSHRLENGLISPRRLFHENGIEWADHVRESVDDLTLAIVAAKRRALKINQRVVDGDPVHWRELIYLPLPAGMKETIRSDAGAGMGANTADDDEDPAPAPPSKQTARRRARADA